MTQGRDGNRLDGVGHDWLIGAFALVGIGAFGAVLVAGPDMWPARLLAVLAFASGFLLLLAALQPSSRHWQRRHPRTIVLAGQGSTLALVEAALKSRHHADSGRGGTVPTRLRTVRCASLDEALDLIATSPCDILVTGSQPHGPSRIVRDRRGRAVRIATAEDMLESITGRSNVHHLVHALPADGLRRDWSIRAQYATKDIADVAGAALMLLVTALPTLLVLTALRLCAERHLIERRRVLGRHGEPFDWLILNAFAPGSGDPASQPSAPALVRSWIWRGVRMSHLHLVPSLVNVLRREMSLVGPRPEPEAWYADRPVIRELRTRMRPGILSLAQVRFDYSSAQRDQRVALEYDAFYVRRFSLVLDFRIFCRGLAMLVQDCLHTLGACVRYVLVRVRRALVAGITIETTSHRFASVPMPSLGPEELASIRPCLIVGAGSAGRQLLDGLRGNLDIGLWPVAFVDDDIAKIGQRFGGVPVLATTQTMDAIIERERIETVVIAIPSASDIDQQRMVTLAQQTGVEVLTLPSLVTILRGAPVTQLKRVVPTDLLGRPAVIPDADSWHAKLLGRTVLVTGAAGSIGREVVRQLARSSVRDIVVLDVNESDIFDLQWEIAETHSRVNIIPVIASVTNIMRLEETFARYRPHMVFHAAAYKHVPMMEEHPAEAIQVNALGTHNVVCASARHGVERFVMVSTDKAVRPSSIMGATKRLAEYIVQSAETKGSMTVCSVRFGNVLGSRGSVIPLFERQIAAGGPVTVTDTRMMRYFMTIPEAAGLIVQAGVFEDDRVIYMLDMGEEVSIHSLAERIIRLHGYRPGIDIDIVVTGLRPGEKLRESLSLDYEHARTTAHPKIRVLQQDHSWSPAISASEVVSRLCSLVTMAPAPSLRDGVMDLVASIDEVRMDPVATGIAS
jgi:FlaA1/EpsC-like NDP-sugar epimerase